MHSAKLQSTIREYIALRLNTKAKPTSPVIPPEEVPPLPSLALDGTKEDNGNDNVPDTPGGDLPTPIPDGAGGQVVPPFAEQVNETTTSDDQTEDAPGANGNGPIETNGTGGKDAEADADGEIVEVEQVVEARKAFPSVSPDRARADFLPPQAIHHETPEPEGSVGGNQAWNLLPEIARLAREMVKNGEEKVAVAQGAYNSVSPPSDPLRESAWDAGLTSWDTTGRSTYPSARLGLVGTRSVHPPWPETEHRAIGIGWRRPGRAWFQRGRGRRR